MNTGIKQKQGFWPEFIKLCEEQWKVGGERYALSEDKEFADLVCEAAGNNWIGGNIIKYVGEIINTEPKPEVNFPKIAVWAFIWWLKEKGNLSKRDRGEEIALKFSEGLCKEIKEKIDNSPAERTQDAFLRRGGEIAAGISDALDGHPLRPVDESPKDAYNGMKELNKKPENEIE